MIISQEKFIRSVGRIPEDDDMERVNCFKKGEPGHYFCGWCSKHDKPRFICGCCWPFKGDAKFQRINHETY